MASERQAFVLRIAPNGIDRVALALGENVAIIGWCAPALMDPSLDWKAFREIVRTKFYSKDDNLRRAGAAAGHMWRFIREMKVGDLLVTPHGSGFYVGRIAGPAFHLPEKVKEDTAYRRRVEWLNGKRPIPRETARAALQSRTKVQGTSADATDLLSEIMECLGDAERKENRTFAEDLKARLAKEALEEMRSGRQPEPPVGPEVVQQLIQGIEAESANLGMVVTSGTISEEATAAAELFFDQKGIRIELVDGPQLAALIVERGLRAV